MEQNKIAAPAVDAANLQALPVDAAELGKLKALAEAANGKGIVTLEAMRFRDAISPAAILRIAALVAQLQADAEKHMDELVEASEAVGAEAAEVKRLESLVAQQAARIEQLETALGFYADLNCWLPDSRGHFRFWMQPNSSTPMAFNGYALARQALSTEGRVTMPLHVCNACPWRGPRDETVMLGSVGPLCPECRETTETMRFPRGLSTLEGK